MSRQSMPCGHFLNGAMAGVLVWQELGKYLPPFILSLEPSSIYFHDTKNSYHIVRHEHVCLEARLSSTFGNLSTVS